MKRLQITLNETNDDVKVEGLKINNTTLSAFRKELSDRGYTEINVVKRAGKYIVDFVTEKISRKQLIDAGLIQGTKKERKEFKEKTSTVQGKKQYLGYAW